MKGSESVQVIARIRPEEDHESYSSLLPPGSTVRCIHVKDERTVQLTPPVWAAAYDRIFTFDRVFIESSSQEEVYSMVSPMIRSAIDGFNVTIFAFGIAESGKSQTMMGTEGDWGVIPRAVDELFSLLGDQSLGLDYSGVRMSFVELFNNQFKNLLEGLPMRETSSYSELEQCLHASAAEFSRVSTNKIEVRECQSAGVFLSGPNLRYPINSAREALNLIRHGNSVRRVPGKQSLSR